MVDNVTVKSAESTRFDAPRPAAIEQSAGILATARSTTGPIVNRDPGPKDIVTIAGGEMTLEQAERMGFVSRGADGRYTDRTPEETDAAIKEANEAPKEEPRDLSNALSFEPEAEAGLKDLSLSLTEAGFNPTSVVADLINNPTELPEAIRMLRDAKGIDQAASYEHVRSLAQSVEDAIGDYLIVECDVSPEQLPAFWQFMMTKHRDKVASAALEAVYVGNARPWKEFAKEFRVGHGSGRGEAKETTRGPRGYAGEGEVDFVNIPGVGKVSREAARRAGLI
jgi:hypothetical protein